MKQFCLTVLVAALFNSAAVFAQSSAVSGTSTAVGGVEAHPKIVLTVRGDPAKKIFDKIQYSRVLVTHEPGEYTIATARGRNVRCDREDRPKQPTTFSCRILFTEPTSGTVGPIPIGF